MKLHLETIRQAGDSVLVKLSIRKQANGRGYQVAEWETPELVPAPGVTYTWDLPEIISPTEGIREEWMTPALGHRTPSPVVQNLVDRVFQLEERTGLVNNDRMNAHVERLDALEAHLGKLEKDLDRLEKKRGRRTPDRDEITQLSKDLLKSYQGFQAKLERRMDEKLDNLGLEMIRKDMDEGFVGVQERFSKQLERLEEKFASRTAAMDRELKKAEEAVEMFRYMLRNKDGGYLEKVDRVIAWIGEQELSEASGTFLTQAELDRLNRQVQPVRKWPERSLRDELADKVEQIDVGEEQDIAIQEVVALSQRTRNTLERAGLGTWELVQSFVESHSGNTAKLQDIRGLGPQQRAEIEALL